MADHGTAWPKELRVSPDRKMLTVSFMDGRSYAIEAELLRAFAGPAGDGGRQGRRDHRQSVAGWQLRGASGV